MKTIIIIAVVLLIVAAIALGIYHDTHNFIVRNYSVDSDKVNRDITFVLISDLHGYVFGKENNSLVEKINEIKPDYILCAGDMFTAHFIDGKIQSKAGFEVLKRLSENFPVFISNGNHEEKTKAFTSVFGNFFGRYKDSLVRLGIHYLENESIYLPEDNIRISGLELPLDYFKKVVKLKMESGTIEKRLGSMSQKERNFFQVLIAHNPQYFPEYAAWGADLTVSGHVPGGIIRLPFLGGVISPAIALFPKYDGGRYEQDGKTMILSRGLGTHTIHVRLNNPGEVSVIKVRSKKNVSRS